MARVAEGSSTKTGHHTGDVFQVGGKGDSSWRCSTWTLRMNAGRAGFRRLGRGPCPAPWVLGAGV